MNKMYNGKFNLKLQVMMSQVILQQNQFSVVLNGKGGHLYSMENGLTSQTLMNHVPSERLKTVHRKQTG